MTTFPCGCIRGERLCPEAEHLWRQVGALYEQARQGTATWVEYEQARAAYDAHFCTVYKFDAS